MKKSIALTILAAASLLVSCKKPVNPDLPVISWPDNPSFAQKELAPGLDGTVQVSAPGKIQSLTITLGLGSYYAALANTHIMVSANKGTAGKSPVFDLIDDSATAAFLKTLGITAGSTLRGNSVAEFDLAAILNALIADQPIENNSSFTLEVKLSDQAGNSTGKTARFHYTSAPSLTWEGNSTFATVDLNSTAIPCKVKLSAPGKIENLSIALEAGAAPELVNWIKNRTASNSTTIDLIGDQTAAAAFKEYFPSGSLVKGKTEVVLDFSFMFANRYDFSSATNVFTITAVDSNGKSVVGQVKFVK